MRLIVECEHGRLEPHPNKGEPGVNAMVASTAGAREFDPSKLDWCYAAKIITDPDAILAALAEAGVLQVEEGNYRYVSKPKEAK